jgi:hypothetical protein
VPAFQLKACVAFSIDSIEIRNLYFHQNNVLIHKVFEGRARVEPFL